MGHRKHTPGMAERPWRDRVWLSGGKTASKSRAHSTHCCLSGLSPGITFALILAVDWHCLALHVQMWQKMMPVSHRSLTACHLTLQSCSLNSDLPWGCQSARPRAGQCARCTALSHSSRGKAGGVPAPWLEEGRAGHLLQVGRARLQMLRHSLFIYNRPRLLPELWKVTCCQAQWRSCWCACLSRSPDTENS